MASSVLDSWSYSRSQWLHIMTEISTERLSDLIDTACAHFDVGDLDLAIRLIDQAKRECENVDSKLWKLKSRARGTLTE